VSVTGKIFSPLLLLLAKLTESELLHTIQFLKAENEMLRSRLPRSVKTTPAERSRLLKLAEPPGNAVKELVSIVTFRTFQRWRADAKKATISWTARVWQVRIGHEVAPLVRMEPGKVAPRSVALQQLIRDGYSCPPLVIQSCTLPPVPPTSSVSA
jgi:hypothetical protein